MVLQDFYLTVPYQNYEELFEFIQIGYFKKVFWCCPFVSDEHERSDFFLWYCSNPGKAVSIDHSLPISIDHFNLYTIIKVRWSDCSGEDW